MAKLIDSLTALSFTALSIIFGGVGGLVGLALLAVTEGWLSPLFGVIVGGYAAVLLSYHHQKHLADTALVELQEIKSSTPRFVFAETRWTPLYPTDRLSPSAGTGRCSARHVCPRHRLLSHDCRHV